MSNASERNPDFPIEPPMSPPQSGQGQSSAHSEPGTNRTVLIIAAVAVLVVVLAVIAVLTTSESPKSEPASTTSGQGSEGSASEDLNGAVTSTLGGAAGNTTGSAAANSTDGSDSTKMVNTHAVKITGDALPELNFSGGVMPADKDDGTGKVVPTITGVDIHGQPSTIGPGKAAVYVFVAHWCPHCQREVPEIVKWDKAGVVPGSVELVAIATATQADQNNYPPSDWLVSEGWPGRTLVDSDQSEAAKAYGLPGFPYFVAVDKGGKVVARGSGELTEDEFKSVVDAAAKGS